MAFQDVVKMSHVVASISYNFYTWRLIVSSLQWWTSQIEKKVLLRKITIKTEEWEVDFISFIILLLNEHNIRWQSPIKRHEPV